MNVLLIPGSRRAASVNRRVLDAFAGRLEAAGADIDRVVPADLDAPLYDGDLESGSGVPASIKALNRRMAAADALVVVTPEYNGFFSPLLKNTLDWMSRAQDGEAGRAQFVDKPALAMAASPGPKGGVRALPHLRQLLANLGMNLYHAQLGVAQAGRVLAEDGEVTDPALAEQLQTLASGFVSFSRRLSAAD